jgi:CheY-like chemotaxis protein
VVYHLRGRCRDGPLFVRVPRRSQPEELIMVNISADTVVNSRRDTTPFRPRSIPALYTVLVVRDDNSNNEYLEAICEFLGIGVEHASSGGDLGPLLIGLRPLAVIADLDGDGQDGFHVMKMAADYNKRLPVLLLTGNETAIHGAIDAVKEVWGLWRVSTAVGMGSVGEVVDFLCHAARDAGHARMLRV